MLFGGSNAFGIPKIETQSPAKDFVFGSAPAFGQMATFSFTAAKNEKEKDITSNNTTDLKAEGKEKKELVPETTSTFADLAKTGSTFADLASNPGGTFADLANKTGNDFANLSANSQGTTVGFNKSAGGGFYNLTHQNAFKNFESPQATEECDDDGDATTDDNYDPHYDAIVELPDEIVVTTGEENETKLFGERAKLYRYDAESKQWKERGKL